MSHIVNSCPLTKLDGDLSRLHSADDDAIQWLAKPWKVNPYTKEEDCLHATVLRYLSELCTSVADVASWKHLRAVHQNELILPRHKLTSAGRHAFSVAAPSVWQIICMFSALELHTFRRQFKDILVCTLLGTTHRAR